MPEFTLDMRNRVQSLRFRANSPLDTGRNAWSEDAEALRALIDAHDAQVERAENAEAELADYAEGRRKVLAEECADDERHCACVPDLRAVLAQHEHMVALLAAERDELRAKLDKANEACRVASKEMQRGIQSMREIREENGELRARLAAYHEDCKPCPSCEQLAQAEPVVAAADRWRASAQLNGIGSVSPSAADGLLHAVDAYRAARGEG